MGKISPLVCKQCLAEPPMFHVDLSQCPVVDQSYQSYQTVLQLVIDCRVSTMIYVYNHTAHNTEHLYLRTP